MIYMLQLLYYTFWLTGHEFGGIECRLRLWLRLQLNEFMCPLLVTLELHA